MSTETHTMTLRLPADLARRLRKRASDDGRSFSGWLRKRLAELSEPAASADGRNGADGAAQSAARGK